MEYLDAAINFIQINTAILETSIYLAPNSNLRRECVGDLHADNTFVVDLNGKSGRWNSRLTNARSSRLGDALDYHRDTAIRPIRDSDPKEPNETTSDHNPVFLVGETEK